MQIGSGIWKIAQGAPEIFPWAPYWLQPSWPKMQRFIQVSVASLLTKVFKICPLLFVNDLIVQQIQNKTAAEQIMYIACLLSHDWFPSILPEASYILNPDYS